MLKKLMPVLFSLTLISQMHAQAYRYDINNINDHDLKKIITALHSGATLTTNNQSGLANLELVLEYGNKELIIGIVGTVAFLGAVNLIFTNRSDIGKIVDKCPRIWSWNPSKHKESDEAIANNTLLIDELNLIADSQLSNSTDEQLIELLQKDLEVD